MDSDGRTQQWDTAQISQIWLWARAMFSCVARLFFVCLAIWTLLSSARANSVILIDIKTNSSIVSYTLNKQPMSPVQLADGVKNAIKQFGDREPILIQPDPQTTFETVFKLLESLKTVGVKRFEIMAERTSIAAGYTIRRLSSSADQVSGLPPVRDKDDSIERLKIARKLPVPEPATTPYDSDSKAKEVYLNEYRSGYRSILAAVDIGCHMGVKGLYFNAFQDGWSDGIEAAKKNHPEKVAQMMGMPLENYLRYLADQNKRNEK